jgi:hypothetical protein
MTSIANKKEEAITITHSTYGTAIRTIGHAAPSALATSIATKGSERPALITGLSKGGS